MTTPPQYSLEAIRESDHRPLLLNPSSVRRDAVSQPAPPQGTVRVRSARGRKWWITAPLITLAGGALLVGGFFIGKDSLCFDRCAASPDRDLRSTVAGLTIGTGLFVFSLGSAFFGVAASPERWAEEISPGAVSCAQ